MAVDQAPNREAMFPEAFVKAAQDAQRATGCYASVTLAQGALESGYWKSMPPESLNPFGIKASPGQPYVECETEEVLHGVRVKTIARFRKFESMAEAFRAHATLLTNPHGPYGHALPYIHDLYKWVRRIGPIYATDGNYSEKVLELLDQWKLTDFDAVGHLSTAPSSDSE